MIRIAICDDEESWWDLRMARHAEFMKLAVEKQIQRHIQATSWPHPPRRSPSLPPC